MASRTFKLKEVCSVLSGFAFKSNFFADAGMPLIRIRDVVRGFTETCYAGDYDEKYVVQNGEILIGMDGDFNLEYWEGGPALLNQRVCKVTPDESVLNKVFLYYFLPLKLKEIWEATPYVTVKHLSSKDVEEIEIPAWPLATQKHIARVLEQADQLRKQAQQMESELNQLAQSLFLEMFGDPVANPKRFGTATIEEVSVRVTKGESPNWQGFSYQESGVRFITSENVRDGELDDRVKYIPIKFHEKLSRSQLLEHDLLVNLVGASVARSCLVPSCALPANINQAVGVVTLDCNKVIPVFVLDQFTLPSFKRRLIGETVEAARANLSLKDIRDTVILCPDIETQRKYADKRKVIDSLWYEQRRKIDLLNDAFKSLMQRAFNGELTTPERKAA